MPLRSLLFIILFLCFSMSVCTARPLVAVVGASNVQFNISKKIPENVKKHSVESSAVTKKEGIESIGAMIQRSKPTKAVDIKKLQSSSKQDFPGPGHAGSDEKFCHMDLLNAKFYKVSRRRASSVIGPANVKKDVETKEDAEVNDYAEPHQTPPIHNRET